MLFCHFKRLCITSATLIAASPLATVASRSNSLPAVLQKSVPLCAQSCLQASLAEKFPVACSGQENIQCLCSRYSNGGESLGEVALGCVYSACSTQDPGATGAYNVCLGQKDAVMPTQRALTIVVTNAPRTTSTSPTPKPTTTPVITTTLRTQVTSTQSVVVDSISSLPLATSTPSSTAALPVTNEEPPKMTPAQIAGLSVAAVAAFVIAVGLMALSVCLRRRKERRNAFESLDEKGSSRKSKKYSTRVSHYVAVEGAPAPPRFPMALPPVARRGGNNSRLSSNGPLYPSRPVQRNGVGTSNSSSNSSLPLEQIGVAISAELDGNSAPPRAALKPSTQPETSTLPGPRSQVPFRPISAMTQDTVFEEDEVATRRRSSVLLPTPPVPVPPIRSLQPSQRASTFDSAMNTVAQHNPSRQGARRSELFLNIPVRHERPQPKRIMPTQTMTTGSPKQVEAHQARRLAAPVQINSTSSPQQTPGSNTGDIDDYYFTAHKDSTARAIAIRNRLRDSPNAGQVKSKRSGSTVSRTASRASTNFRDSVSSQTSFETADPNDPTPEDEDDDKQLSDDSKLSPVAESPISNLRYPKIPRASNQLVPRSPRSPQNVPKLNSPSRGTPRRNQASPPSASHLVNRRKDLAPPLLETRLPLRLNAPRDIALVPRPQLQDPFTSPPRNRVHARSNSTESWSTTPRSKLDRKSRTQSGMWPSSPAMFDDIRPLNVKRKDEPLRVRRNRDEMKEINVGRDVDHDAEVNGLKSPIWVPRLTPTRKGEDLFISVGWGGR